MMVFPVESESSSKKKKGSRILRRSCFWTELQVFVEGKGSGFIIRYCSLSLSLDGVGNRLVVGKGLVC